MTRRGTRRGTRKIKHRKYNRHNFSVSLEKINNKCYKNGRKIPCRKFMAEERKVEKGIWSMFGL
jgi:hypothetical protein